MQQGKEEKHKTTRKVTFFDGKKIKDILEMMTDFNTFLGLNDKLITVPEKATVEEALKEMKARNVTSLPIEGKDGKIKGLVSTLDIVVGVVFAPMYTRYNEEATSKLRLEDLKSITTNKALFESQVANLVGIHEETRTLSEFWDDDDLSLLAHRMSMGVHRALIKPRDKTKKMRIVTQTDFLNYIAQRIVTDPRIAKIMSQTIGKLGLVETTEVVTVKNTDRAVLGFRKLWMGGKWFDWSLSALPIVDAKGELVGNLSGSDMRNMTKDNLDDLLLSVEDFLWKMNGKSKMRTPVTVTLDTPFLQAVEKVMGNGIHRLWVTGTDEGEKKKVKGALSLTDIIYKFSTFDLSRHPIKVKRPK